MSRESPREAAIAVQDEIRVGHVANLEVDPVAADADGDDLRRRMEAHSFDRTLVRDADGVVSRFVVRGDLRPGPISDCAQRIDVSQVTHASTPVLDVVPDVVRQGFLFVAGRRGVRGILTTADLQKVPVRIALFGLTTSLELVVRDAIARHLGDRDPLQYLTEKRRADAVALLEKRKQRSQDLSLIECLQLCDLGTLAAKLDLHDSVFGRPSKRALAPDFDSVEKLRNGLAHANELDLDELPRTIDALHDLLRTVSGAAA